MQIIHTTGAMTSNCPKFDEDAFQNQLATSSVGRKIVYTEVTGSTMDDARRLAHDVTEYPHGTVVMSERQTKARGARDHKWDASNTGNIYVSFILHLPPSFKTFEGRFDLEVTACLATLQVMRKFGVIKAVPKWPNDLWVKGKKLAGFLVEDGRFDIPGSHKCLFILGIGINVNADVRRSGDLHSIATSLLCENGGVYVNREAFFAETCASLEKMLSQSRGELRAAFTKENLFQHGCDISVTCPSVGKVIDGEFLEICDNWEVKFSDKQTGEILQGRSDFYTVRPKVVNKILVVFTGLQDNKSANDLSKWLVTVVDTAKYVVCLVPETTITSTDTWMKTCSLLVLPEPIGNPNQISSRFNSYLRSGGCVMTSGLGSLFAAKTLDIPLQERLLDSTVMEFELGYLNLCAETHIPGGKIKSVHTSGEQEAPTLEGGAATLLNTESLILLSSPTCFQFFEDEKALLSEGGDGSKIKKQLNILSSSVQQGDSSKSNNNSDLDTAYARAFYMEEKEGIKTFAMFTARISNGHIALWGFDIGTSCRVKSVSEEAGSRRLSENMRAAYEDRFKRDILLQQVLAVVLDDFELL